MSDVAVGVADRVIACLREGCKWREVAPGDDEPGLLCDLVDRGLGEATAHLSRTGRQTPRPVVGSLGQEYLACEVLKCHHRAGHEDQLIADLLAQLPQIRADVGNASRVPDNQATPGRFCRRFRLGYMPPSMTAVDRDAG